MTTFCKLNNYIDHLNAHSKYKNSKWVEQRQVPIYRRQLNGCYDPNIKVKSCYNPLRLGTVIVLVSSGIDFVNTQRLYSDQATR